MPDIPRQEVFTQGQYGYQDIRVNPAAFGATVGPALEQASDVGANIVLARQSILNEKAVTDADTLHLTQQQDLLYGKDGFLSKQGDTAVKSYEDYQKRSKEIYTGVSDGLTNPVQKRMFDQVGQSALKSIGNAMGSHAVSEQRKALTESSQARTDAYIVAGANNYNNPKQLEDSASVVKSEAQKIAETQGLADPAVIAGLQKKGLSQLYAGAATKALADGHWETAQSILKDHGESIDPTAYATLMGKAENDQINSEAPTVATGIYAKHGGDLHASEREAMKIESKPMRNQVMSLIRQAYSLDATERTQYRQEIQQRFADARAGFINTGVVENPPSEKELGIAFGPVLAKKYSAELGQYENVGLTLQKARTLPELEQAKLLEDNKPTPSTPNAAGAWQSFKMLETGIREINEQRRSDPAGYVIQNDQGSANAYNAMLAAQGDPSLTPGQRVSVMSDYVKRVTAAQESMGLIQHGKKSSPDAVFPKPFIEAIKSKLDGASTAQKIAIFSDIQKATNPRSYASTMTAIAADRPELAGFGALSGATTSEGRSVAALGLEGIKLLTSADSKKGTFVMPKDKGGADPLVPLFNNEVGTGAFADSTQKDTAYQMAKAVYAKLSFEAGEISGEQNNERFKQAIRLVTGGIYEHAGNQVIKPYGMSDDDFGVALRGRLMEAAATYGGKYSRISNLQLSPAPGGSGQYYLSTGRDFVRKPNSTEPVVIDVNGYAPTPEDALVKRAARMEHR